MARFNPDDPDETEGRVLARAQAEGMVRTQDALAARKVRLADDEPPDPWAHKGGSWVCDSCGWEGDPDSVGDVCPGCGITIEDEAENGSV